MSDQPPLPEGWIRNNGSIPGMMKGTSKRVKVLLRNGTAPKDSWPADTNRHQSTRWTLDGSPFDIIGWKEVD